MSRRFWTGFAIFALLVLIAAFVALNYEPVTEEVPVPASAEARRDRFLLAERLLRRLGVETRRIGTLDSAEPLPTDALLLVPSGRGAISRTGSERLLAFVAGGGHLLVESEYPGNADPLLDAFGISRHEYRWQGDDRWVGEGFDRADKRAEYPAGWSGMVVVRPAADGPALRVLMTGDSDLRAQAPRWRAADRSGTRALQIAYGAGRVTAVNDLRFATNDELARADHAEFLWQLVRTGPARQVLIYRGHTENLWQWLTRKAWAALIALAALIVLWLWQAMPRFGPRLPDPEPVRRRLLDHLAASGRFLWSRGQRARLAIAACRAAHLALLRRHPHLAGARPAEQAQFLVRRFGIAAAAAERIVEPALVRDPRELIEIARACADLQRELVRPRSREPHRPPGSPHP